MCSLDGNWESSLLRIYSVSKVAFLYIVKFGTKGSIIHGYVYIHNIYTLYTIQGVYMGAHDITKWKKQKNSIE